MSFLNRRKKQQLIYVAVDLISSIFIWGAFLIFRWLVYEERIWSVDTVLIPMFDFYRALVLYPLACLTVYYLSGYYLRPLHKPYMREFRRTLISAIFISVVSFFCIVIDDAVENYQQYWNSLVTLFLLQWLGSYFPRLIVTYLTHKYADNSLRSYTIQTKEDVEIFEQAHAIEAYDEVILDLKTDSKEQDIYYLINRLYPAHVEIAVVPSLYDMLTGAAIIGDVEDQPLIRITEHRMSDTELCIKRAFDIVMSLGAILVLSPVYLVLGVLVRSSSSGPIFYKQARIGLHGVPFNIIKFRTMEMNAEGMTPQLSFDNDPRVTKVGRILRKYRLDELPQFWNILRGDMSIVGPRPERRYFIDQIEKEAPYYCLIYKIRPGLTSWGPIKVGYTDTLEKMVKRLNYDIVYIENMSLRLDLKIMFHTISVILNGQGK
jgi:lipopolysaccharide/colanic/teichoic acid biosynthesis glycosyltransferase